MATTVDWHKHGLDFVQLKEQVETLRGQHIEVQLLFQSNPADTAARMLALQSTATIAQGDAIIRELERFSDPTFDFDSAAKTMAPAVAAAASVAAVTAGSTAVSTTKIGKFTLPAWGSASPLSESKLEAIKDGEVVFMLELSKRPFFVIGKQKELCHVTLEHASISRQHAAIVHGKPPKASEGDADTNVWLIDLDSAHGTYMGASVEKLRKIKPHVPYALTPGFVVRIGKSSRVYKVRAADADDAPAAKRARTDGDD